SITPEDKPLDVLGDRLALANLLGSAFCDRHESVRVLKLALLSPLALEQECLHVGGGVLARLPVETVLPPPPSTGAGVGDRHGLRALAVAKQQRAVGATRELDR